MKFFFYIILTFLLSSNSFAENTKPSDYFLPKVKSDINEIQIVISQLKNYMQGIEATGSFVKNDFWGITPSFYFNRNSSGITSLYFLHDLVVNNLQHMDKNTLFVRQIDDINLYPTVLDKWMIPLYFNYDELLPNEGNQFTDSSALTFYFLSNHVPPNKVKDALDAYAQSYDKVATLILENIVSDIDELYSGVYQNQDVAYAKSFVKLFKKNDNSSEGFVQAEQNLQVNSLHEALNLRTKDEFLQKIANGQLDRINTLSIIVSIYRYEFEVGTGLKNKDRASQINAFDQLLKQKVERGNALSSVVKRKGYETDYIAYSDISGSVKYPATIFFDKATGEGVWQIGYWDSKNELKQINSQLYAANEQLKVSFQDYLASKMKELASRYASPVGLENFSGEF